MKLIHQCFYSTCLCVLAVPAYSQQTLWYSGDTTAPSTYANGVGITPPGVPFFLVYQDFVVPAPGWHITSVFGNDYFAVGSFSTSATWEIRSGMPAGNGGALVATADAAVTRTATGRTSTSGSLALTEFKTQLNGLSLDLPPGHYWLAVTPDDNDNWSPLSSETSGANCIGTPCGNSGNAFVQNRTMLPITFPAVSVNFSMGVIGTVAQGPVPSIVCQANVGNPFLVRAEGITESIGDILLSCSGGTPTPAGQPIPMSALEVSLNTTITSRLLDQSTGLSEAMLTIDEPNPGSGGVPNNTVVLPPANSVPQMICATTAGCAETGTGGSTSPYQTQPNVFLGQVSGSSIVWNNVPIDPPGPNVNRTIRITNLRANASQLPLSTTLIPTQITAVISDASLEVLGQTQTAAFIQRGVIASETNASISQCASHNASLIGGTGTPAFDFNLTASEGFASSFKRREIGLTVDGPTAPQVFAQNVPGYPYTTESGFYAPALFSVGSRAGLADFGTRIRVTFTNIGAGVRLFVPISFPLTKPDASTSTPQQPPAPVAAGIANAQIQLVQADQYGNSASPGYTSVPAVAIVQGSPVAEMTYSGNTAYAVYEIVNSDPNVPETAAIPVAVAFSITGTLPALGWVNVNISQAPAGGPFADIPNADATAPIPRFADTSVSQLAYTIIPCFVPMTVTTNPAGLQVVVDSVGTASPQSVSWIPASSHTVAVASPQGNSSSQYLFSSWSDGGAQSHQVTAPSSPTTYTANFTTQYFLTMNAGPGGAVSPSSNWFNAGQTVAISATPASGATFTGWTGTGTGSFTGGANSASITMNGPITETASFHLSNGTPSAVSVTPNTGSGATQTFAFAFTDPNGAADITSGQIDISATLSVSGACYLYYPRALNEIYLASDSGVWQGPLVLGATGILQNSQCAVNAGASSASTSGNTLTLNLALSFKAGFAGAKNVYMEVQNAAHDSGWSQFGAWTVASGVQSSSPPAPVSVTPSSGSGASQTFAFAFSDANGATDITSAQIDISATLSVSGACYLYYPRGLNEIYLASDAGVWQGPITLGSTGTLQNSQCAVNVEASSASSSGTTLTLNLALSFKAGFAGAKNVYMEVQNSAHDSGWSAFGAWTVPGAAPAPDFSIGMSAGPGSVAAGGSAAYTVTVTGNNGFNGTVSFGTSGLPSGVTGSFNPTTVTGSGSTTLTIMTTSGASPGGITITVTGTSGSLNHNTTASLTITGGSSNGMPIANSVTPHSGSGASQTFAFAFSDPNGATDITSAQIDISATLSVAGACYLYYPRGLNEMYLASDTGVWQGPLKMGSTGTLQNSQCTLNVGASSATASGNTLTLNLALTFTAGFFGGKNVYLEVQNAAHDSGWSELGSWTVPGSVQSGSPPAGASVTPSSGSGFSQTFAFAFSDGNGAADITSAQIDISPTLSVSGACYLYYPRALNEIYLASDTGVWQGPLKLGSAGTLQNSQCTVNPGASSAVLSGNTLTLNLALTFKNVGAAQTENVYMEVENATHDSGWSLMGTWIVP